MTLVRTTGHPTLRPDLSSIRVAADAPLSPRHTSPQMGFRIC